MMPDFAVAIAGVATNETSLSLPSDLPFDQWEEIGSKIHGMARNLQWWWGDWLNFGEKKYGEKYKVAVEKFGINLKTAQQMAWVAREFESSNRLELSWTHHLAAAGIADESEQAEILEEAKKEEWSVARLRQEIKGKQDRKAESEASPEPEDLSDLIAEIRRTCADWRARFGVDRMETLADFLQDEATTAREWNHDD